MNVKNTTIAAVISIAMTPGIALADLIDMSLDGLFTLTNNGVPLVNSDATNNADLGYRTNITGTATLDTATGAGTGTIAPFDFLGSGPMVFSSIFFQQLGDGFGGPGSLMVYDMDANWNGSTFQMAGIMDASGLLSNLSAGAGTTVSSGCIGCATSTTANWSAGPAGPATGIIGPNPWVMNAYTVNYNTTRSNRGSVAPVDNGGLGSPMPNGPFPGYVPNFDFTSVTVESITQTSTVPVPAAVWLFGSGLMVLIRVAKHT